MEIGNLKRLGAVGTKKLWPKEDKDFSPWLANNITQINDLLKMQIEILENEGQVDNFKLDLYGIDGASKRPVVIENQFGPSDHDHLGKLLTYSADRDAGIVIWIANDIQPAHRKAIEWLNTITPNEMSLFAIELDVLQIDSSPLSPSFVLVAGPPPNKRRETTPSDQVSPRNKQYQAFFENLKKKLLELQPGFTNAKALPQSYWALGIGRTGFSLTPAFTSDEKFRIELYVDTGVKGDNDIVLSILEGNKVRLEDEIGLPLIWDHLYESRGCRAYAAIDGTIDDNDEKLVELINWGAPLMVKFRDTFSLLIKNMDWSSTS